MPKKEKGLAEPVLYETIDVVPLGTLEDSVFDYEVDIVERGNSFFMDGQNNLVELRRMKFKEIRPGTYYRYGDVLLKERQNNL